MYKKRNGMRIKDLIKTGSFLAAFVLSTAVISAQTKNDVIKAYNEGAGAIQTDALAAIKAFENVVALSKQVGDSATDLRQKAIKVLPSLYYNVASDALTAKKPAADVIKAAKNAIAAAEKYENPTTKQNATNLLLKGYNILASDFFSKNDYPNAIASFDSVLAINPDYASTIYNKSLIYMKQANSDEFEKTVDLYLTKMKPGADDARIKQASSMALGYFRAAGSKADASNKLDDALTALTKAAKYGDDKDLFYYFAEVYNKQKNYDKGLEYGKKGLDLEAGAPEAKAKFYFQIALAQEGKGQTAEACETFKNSSFGIFAEPSKVKRNNLKCK
jgi:tetratricopeptide (TPR) repeat protein